MEVKTNGTLDVLIGTNAEKSLVIFALNYAKDNMPGITPEQQADLSAVAGALNSAPSLV